MKVLITGCGVAGFSAARKLKELKPDVEVVLADSEGLGLYAKIRLSEHLSGKLPAAKLMLNGPEALTKLGLRHLRGVSVEALDLANGTAKMSDGSTESFDKLAIASGAVAANPCLAACGNVPVFMLRIMADSEAIISACAKARSAVVLGGGLLGLEAAWALKSRNLEVSVVECQPRLLPRQLNDGESALLLKKMSGMGFAFHIGRKMECLTAQNGRKKLRFDNGLEIETDIVLVSAGIRPRIELAQAAGIATASGIKVDSRLETSVKDVFAIGDCAEISGRVIGLWAASKDQGEALGEILAGVRQSFESPVYAPALKVPGIQFKELKAEAAAACPQGVPK